MDDERWQFVGEATGPLIHSPIIADGLDAPCVGDRERVTLEASLRIRQAQVYPEPASVATARVLRRQEREDAMGRFTIGSVDGISERDQVEAMKSTWDDTKTQIGFRHGMMSRGSLDLQFVRQPRHD